MLMVRSPDVSSGGFNANMSVAVCLQSLGGCSFQEELLHFLNLSYTLTNICWMKKTNKHGLNNCIYGFKLQVNLTLNCKIVNFNE